MARVEGGERADTALQKTFRSETGVPPETRKAVSELVFAHYRWFGWLDESESLTQRLAQVQELDQRFESLPESFSDEELIKNAMPQWLRDYMPTDIGFVRALQGHPRMFLRSRPGKAEELARAIDCTEVYSAIPDCLNFTGSHDLFKTGEFKSGQFEIQDISSQAVSLCCSPKPGQTWWDACAGEGGKTLHLCDLLGRKGLVWASDRAQWRLDVLKKRAGRAGIYNYRVKLWTTPDKPAVGGPFDGILIDAPCSGTGTWGRNPQARWTLRPEDISELAEVQRKLLEVCSKVLKPGGKLFYSVCTLTRAETTAHLETLRERKELMPFDFNNPFTREPGSSFLFHPADHGGIGMFIAAWQRIG